MHVLGGLQVDWFCLRYFRRFLKVGKEVISLEQYEHLVPAAASRQ
jgi:hypothetical protein